MRSGSRLALAALLAVSSAAGGADPAPKKASKSKLEVPKIDLSGLGSIPNLDGVRTEREKPPALKPQVVELDVKYEVKTLAHALDFNRTAKGHAPTGSLLRSIALTGSPLTTQQFATFVRVRATREGDAPIEIEIGDPTSREAPMTGRGSLSFKGTPADGDWVIVWDPTPRLKGGTYQVVVRVAGQRLGSWPLEFVAH